MSRFATVRLSILAGLLVTGCKGPDHNAQTKIIGGVDAAQDIHPWTVRLAIDGGRLCTGTFVSPTTLLTASHCVKSNSSVKVPRYNNVSSVAVYKHPSHGGAVDRFDVAVVVFPANPASNFTSLTTRMPQVGEDVAFVGYGSCTEWDGADTGKRRCMGSNKVSSVSANSMISSNAGRGADGVAVSPGDSGGPMFIEASKLAGIASGGGYGRDSLHTNLLMAENQSFLQGLANNSGVVICGLNGNSGQECSGAGVGGAADYLAQNSNSAGNQGSSGPLQDQLAGGNQQDSNSGNQQNSNNGSQPNSPQAYVYDHSRKFSYRGKLYYCPSGMILYAMSSGRLYCM